MNARTYMRGVRSVNRELECDAAELKRLEALEKDLPDDPERRRKLRARIAELTALREKAYAMIDALPDADERAVLVYHYFQGLTWREIARKMYVSESTAKRWGARALKHLRVSGEG